ncbi:MAG TPA: hypothetical protein VKT78_10700, partial [Fimbriimonadaceae bacterium]|nr:hypothetical protein [Fimbriimonadaceae bacterium]
MTTAELSPDPMALRERAGELFDYLRTTPPGRHAKASELAERYALPVDMVERLLERMKPRRRELNIPWLRPVNSTTRFIKQLARTLCRTPYVVIGLPPLLALLVRVWPQPEVAARIATSVGLVIALVISPIVDLGIYYSNKRSREVVFGALVQALACGYVVTRLPIDGFLRSDSPVLLLTVGLAYGALHFTVGETLLLIGTVVTRNREARRDLMLSRQELLSRYFDLQARLAHATVRERKKRPVLAFLQRYPFWIALGSVLIDNVPARLMMRHSGFDAANPLSSLGHASNGLETALLLVLVGALLSLVEWILIGALAAAAEKFRSIWWICCGCLLGELVFGLALPVKGVAPMLSGPGIMSLAIGLVTYFIPVSLIFVGFKLHRDWQTKRRAEEGDADAVLGELLDVQWRLAAAPTDVYVLVVDVVGSTRMKDGADALNAEYSFRAFQAWVGSVVTARGGRIEVTAGDSAIAAFGDPLQAVTAGQQLLKELER